MSCGDFYCHSQQGPGQGPGQGPVENAIGTNAGVVTAIRDQGNEEWGDGFLSQSAVEEAEAEAEAGDEEEDELCAVHDEAVEQVTRVSLIDAIIDNIERIDVIYDSVRSRHRSAYLRIISGPP
jgi:hypothetical protein